jgi:hypothetical protein
MPPPLLELEPELLERVPEWCSVSDRLWEKCRREYAVCVAAHTASSAAAADESVLQWAIDTLIALLVVPHGLTDAWALPVIPMGISYALSAGAFGSLCPERWLPLVGAVASVVHFAMDLGYGLSSCLVLACIVCHVRQRDQVAYCLLVAYMLLIHLPQHYTRVIPDTSMPGWLALAAFAAGSWHARPLVLLRASSLCRRVAVTLIVAHTIANTVS